MPAPLDRTRLPAVQQRDRGPRVTRHRDPVVSGSTNAPSLEGVVVQVDPARVTVDLGGEQVLAGLSGGLKAAPRRQAHLVAVGDRVLVTTEGADHRIIEVLPRRNQVSRADPGDRTGRREQVLAANLDWLAVVVSLKEPPLNRRVLDRLLVLGEISDLPALIVLNKIDQHPDERDALAGYLEIGYPVLEVSARSGAGLLELSKRLTAGLTLLCGPSGVGKSSLANALAPGGNLRTADVSRSTGKGVHTTTRVGWRPLRDGGALLDSPGIRGVRPFGLSPANLASCFPEFRALSRCQFSDCKHRDEPACAVRAAVLERRVFPDRYESYLRMLDALQDEVLSRRRGGEWD